MMKHIFMMLLITIMIGLSGCTGASETNSEYPTITLQGDRDITLKVGQLIKEPGYSASDIKDGDLTSRVKVESNLDYYREGTYYVKYTVQDSDGYTATESRTVTITENGANSGTYAGDYQYGDVGSVYYDFATYNYNYLVREEGKSIEQKVHEYDANGERIVDVVFERNKNDGSIYEYNNNQIENRDYIGIDTIQSVDSSSNITKFLRNVRINEVFVDKTMDGVRISCKMVEHLGSIDTQALTNTNILNFHYIDVLHAECSSSSGLTFDTYFANGWGEVLTITTQNNQVVEYSVLDKDSMREVY
jgi:hypothetical protein